MANKEKEPVGWITVNGKRVPIFEGESKADAVKKITGDKEKQIEANKKEAEKKNAEEKQKDKSKKETLIKKKLEFLNKNVQEAKANKDWKAYEQATKEYTRIAKEWRKLK